MKYVIMKGNTYVTNPGSYKSYTDNILNARIFNTYESALKEKCGNETIVDYYKIVG